MAVWQWSEFEILTFFAVLIRFSVLFMVMPLLGDNVIPAQVKILLSFIVSLIAFPILMSSGQIDPASASVWASSAMGIIKVVTLEAVFGLALGFSCKIVFEAVQICGEICAHMMGYAAASTYDPNQESYSQVISRFQYAVALLLFIAVDGHHWILQGIVESYRFVGIGQVSVSGTFIEGMLNLSGEMIRTGVKLSAPIALSLFVVNIVYAVVGRAMPQLNLLVLSFSVSALVGLFVLFLGLPEFGSAVGDLFQGFDDRMGNVMRSLKGK